MSKDYIKGEIWRNVGEIYKGLDNYEVSNMGRMYSLFINDFMNSTFNSSNEYKRVHLHYKNKGGYKNFAIHRLVAEFFIENDDPKNKLEVNHIDGNPNNNRAKNLEWISKRDNTLHAIKNNIKVNKSPIYQFYYDKKNNEYILIRIHRNIELTLNYIRRQTIYHKIDKNDFIFDNNNYIHIYGYYWYKEEEALKRFPNEINKYKKKSKELIFDTEITTLPIIKLFMPIIIYDIKNEKYIHICKNIYHLLEELNINKNKLTKLSIKNIKVKNYELTYYKESIISIEKAIMINSSYKYLDLYDNFKRKAVNDNELIRIN